MAAKPKSPACVSCGSVSAKQDKAKAGYCNRCSKRLWDIANPVQVRAQRLHGNATKRAKTFGWPKPDFSSSYIEEKILEGRCEVTGIPFDLTTVHSEYANAKNPWVPSIDRIDSSKPYLKDNIQIVVYMYNVCKSEFSHTDVLTFVNAVHKKENENGSKT